MCVYIRTSNVNILFVKYFQITTNMLLAELHETDHYDNKSRNLNLNYGNKGQITGQDIHVQLSPFSHITQTLTVINPMLIVFL